MPRFKFALSAD